VTALRAPVHGHSLRPPLVPARRRPMAVVAILAAVAVVAALAATVWHATTTPFDLWAFRVLHHHVGDRAGAALLDLSSPAIPVALLAAAVVVGLRQRRRDIAALAVLGPSICVVSTEWVLKPLVGRVLVGNPAGRASVSHALAFPSGHETGVASTALVLLIAASLLTFDRRRRAAIVTLLALWTVLAGIGLVRMHWHYATDVLAAVGVCVAGVLGCAVVLGPLERRLSSPGGRNRPRTSRAS
jgi:undecaprenyl-diphosphatase